MSVSALSAPVLQAPCPGPHFTSLSLVTGDARADQSARTVSLERRRVLISRRLDGIDMRIGVPMGSYRGVALSLSKDDPALWQVTLVHRDPDLSIPLTVTPDDVDVIADWRSWSQFFMLPALLETEPGQFLASLETRPARATSASAKPRRRGRLLTRRRARFLVRRKSGRAERLQTCFRDEDEIIARH
jgi:hypothetical protein